MRLVLFSIFLISFAAVSTPSQAGIISPLEAKKNRQQRDREAAKLEKEAYTSMKDMGKDVKNNSQAIREMTEEIKVQNNKLNRVIKLLEEQNKLFMRIANQPARR